MFQDLDSVMLHCPSNVKWIQSACREISLSLGIQHCYLFYNLKIHQITPEELAMAYFCWLAKVSSLTTTGSWYRSVNINMSPFQFQDLWSTKTEKLFGIPAVQRSPCPDISDRDLRGISSWSGIGIFEDRQIHTNAPINCFRDGVEGGQTHGELIFSKKSCQIPVPWVNISCQIPHPRD